ncbi:hypothetical protein THAOC_11045, partial [Thalassiosira oceanica]
LLEHGVEVEGLVDRPLAPREGLGLAGLGPGVLPGGLGEAPELAGERALEEGEGRARRAVLAAPPCIAAERRATLLKVPSMLTSSFLIPPMDRSAFFTLRRPTSDVSRSVTFSASHLKYL